MHILLDVVHAVPADVPHGNLCVLGVFLDLLGQVLSALLRQLGEDQADHPAVVKWGFFSRPSKILFT